MSLGLQKEVIYFQPVGLGEVKWKIELSGWTSKIKWAGGLMENELGEGGRQGQP